MSTTAKTTKRGGRPRKEAKGRGRPPKRTKLPIEKMNPVLSYGNKIKWKFENVKELTDGGMYSDKFTFQGVDWKVRVCTDTQNSIKYLSVYLYYGGDNKSQKNWICEARRVFKILNQNDKGKALMKECVDIYNNDALCWGFQSFLEWSKVESGEYMKDDSIIVEIDFDFKYYDFSNNIPNYTDIILIVEDTKFHVNKGLLCSKSEYFYKMFVVDNSDEKELTIENVKIDDFRYFIASFCLLFEVVKDHNYEQLSKLADEYKTPELNKICEKFIISNETLQIEKKFEYADRYNYHELMKTCINSITTTDKFEKIRDSIEFENLKDTTKLAIMSHVLNLV